MGTMMDLKKCTRVFLKLGQVFLGEGLDSPRIRKKASSKFFGQKR
jgi:hypothetical protein